MTVAFRKAAMILQKLSVTPAAALTGAYVGDRLTTGR